MGMSNWVLGLQEIEDAKFAAKVEAIEDCAKLVASAGDNELAHRLRMLASDATDERLNKYERELDEQNA